jgi:hypothetical protein
LSARHLLANGRVGLEMVLGATIEVYLDDRGESAPESPLLVLSDCEFECYVEPTRLHKSLVPTPCFHNLRNIAIGSSSLLEYDPETSEPHSSITFENAIGTCIITTPVSGGFIIP